MRLSFAVGSFSVGVATLLALYACGDDGSSSGGTTPAPDGPTIGPDGEVVVPDAPIDTPDAAKLPKVDVTNQQLTVAGGTRDYVLSVPKSYDASRKYPLIVALHGDGQNADGFRVFLGLDDVSGDDAIVAYPDQVVDLFKAYDQNQDQQLVEAVINEVKSQRSIDAARIWGFGYSKGGFIINELACRRPGLFKAIAGHACGAPQVLASQCPGIVGLPVMVTEGDHDTGIGASFAAGYWAQVNKCGDNRTPSTPAGCATFDGCPASTPVVYCLAPNVSHFPIWADAVQVSWTFFKGL